MQVFLKDWIIDLCMVLTIHKSYIYLAQSCLKVTEKEQQY